MPLDDYPSVSAKTEGTLEKLATSLSRARTLSLQIAAPLSAEDQVVQAHEDASPAKWHLAHTTWFFEEIVLKPYLPGYRVFDERFSFCFNSYYESLGARHPRPKRGLLTRPSADDVKAYRAYVDENLDALISRSLPQVAAELIETGINHEQQHQELMLTDILALFAENPLKPLYHALSQENGEAPAAGDGRWKPASGGVYTAGHRGSGFAFDNEGPAHEVLLRDFKLFSREVTNGEWMDFMNAGGYSNPSLWLADGWTAAQREGWEAPGYWEMRDGAWHQMSLHGLLPAEAARPVTHVSYYEADAFARWSGHRLPTEFEWEVAAAGETEIAPFKPSGLRPSPAHGGNASLLGNLWQWTQSAYAPYPGYKPVPGPLGEYNGKFMCNQLVLRGGSVATPDGHVRTTYRNFFYPHQRWQFMGLRLASDA